MVIIFCPREVISLTRDLNNQTNNEGTKTREPVVLFSGSMKDVTPEQMGALLEEKNPLKVVIILREWQVVENFHRRIRGEHSL